MNDSKVAYPGSPAIKVTCVVPQERGDELREMVAQLGIDDMTVQHARRTLLHERRIRIRDSVGVSEELMEIVKLRIQVADEEQVIPRIVRGYGFGEPGQGSIVSQRINILGHALPCCKVPLGPPPEPSPQPMREVAVLCSIVSRGEGTTVARAVLNAGLGAPTVTYASGVASRARLGLIRVTIPAEKEIVTSLVARHDIREAFRMVTEVLRTDRPGAGFCYWSPVDEGILDTRMWIGRQPHVASMEQVIAALDLMTGDTAWRSKMERTSSHSAAHPVRLISYTVYGPETDTEPVVNSALAAGAGGATLSRVHRELLRDASDIPSAYESSELIIPETVLSDVHEAVMETGLIEQRGFLELAEVGEATGYRSP